MKTILVADDDIYMRELLYDYLTEQGYKVRTVANGEEAIKSIKEFSFELVITDYNMGKITGLDLLNIVSKKIPNIGMVLMSGSSNEELIDFKSLFLKDRYAFLHKPFTVSELKSVIEKILSPQLRLA